MAVDPARNETQAQPPPPRRRRGRRALEAGSAPVAQEVRRRREALGFTVRQAAERAHVTAAMISEIERGRRVPSVRTWAKLRQALSIDAPLAVLTRSEAPTEVLEAHVVRLACCLIASGGRARLPDLGQALGLPAAAVREQLPLVAPRLAACGLQLLTDGLEARVEPMGICNPALQSLGALQGERRRRALSEEGVIVLSYVGWHGEATRRDVERFRGEDSETLLGRLFDADLLAAVRDDSQLGRPNRYRLTVNGLRTLGAASPEDLREQLRPHLGALVEAAGGDGGVPLEDQLAVLALVAGFDEVERHLIARALRVSDQACEAALEHFVASGLLTIVPTHGAPRYRLGSAGLAVLGSDGAAAVHRVAERAGIGVAGPTFALGEAALAGIPPET